MTMNVCVTCQAQFLPKKLGVTVIETAGNPPRPMRLWSADVLGCPICGAEILSQFSHEPVAEWIHSEAGFELLLAEVPPDRKYMLHNPEYLTQTVRHETTYVRSYGNNRNLRKNY